MYVEGNFKMLDFAILSIFRDSLKWRLEKIRFVQIAHLWYFGKKERPLVAKTYFIHLQMFEKSFAVGMQKGESTV